MSDTLLSDRLVAAGVRAVDFTESPETRDLVEGVTAAVLRELAVMDRTVKGGDAFLADDFDQLADEIEQR